MWHHCRYLAGNKLSHGNVVDIILSSKMHSSLDNKASLAKIVEFEVGLYLYHTILDFDNQFVVNVAVYI